MRNLIILFISFSILISCKDYSIENYPNLAVKMGTYEHIESCYFIQTENINVFPKNIRDSILSYYKRRIGKEYLNKLEFDFGYINSDKPIKSASEEYKIDSSLFDYWEKPEICDSLHNFPVYTSAFNLKIPELGIKKLGLNLVIDSKGKIAKDFQYPHLKKNANQQKIISIDSVISILIKRKISNEHLYIDIDYDKETGFLFWEPRTNLHPNDNSCLLMLKTHFSMNMFTGEIKEIDDE